MAIKPPWSKMIGHPVQESIINSNEMIPGLVIEEGFVKIGNKAFDAEQLGIMLSYLEELTKEAKPEEFI
jgi:hypothetical protein